MKYCLIFLLLLAHRTTMCQPATIVPTTPSAVLEKTLLEEMYRFSNAWATSDTATLNKLLAPEYRHSDVFGEIQHRSEWLNFAAKKRDVFNLEITDVEILVY